VGAFGLFAMRLLPVLGFLSQRLLPNPLAKPGRTDNPVQMNRAVDAAARVTGIKIIMLSGV
jgi:hypothetical protein